MARKNELDTADVLHLKDEIAKVRMRLARWIELEEDRQRLTADGSASVGRLYEVFRFINEF